MKLGISIPKRCLSEPSPFALLTLLAPVLLSDQLSDGISGESKWRNKPKSFAGVSF